MEELKMKRLAKKSLSIFLAVILASTMFVTAFAVDEAAGAIEYFSADINYETNDLGYLYFVVTGFSIANEEDFACTILDSQDNEVFNETMGEVEFITLDMMNAETAKRLAPADEDEDEMEFIMVNIYVYDTVTLNPDELYTLVVAPGSFSNMDEQESPEMTYEFLASDYIYVPTIWDKILFVLHSNPVFEFLFARLITLIELFYYSPFPNFPIYY